MGQTVKREIQFCPLQYSSDARLRVERLSKSKSQNFNEKVFRKKLKISIKNVKFNFARCNILRMLVSEVERLFKSEVQNFNETSTHSTI